MTERIALSEIVELNPRLPRSMLSHLEQKVSFIPMAAVSEKGYILEENERILKEVIKGYTYFQEGDVLLAKITPCFENGKATIASNLTHNIGFGSTEFHVLRPSKNVDAQYLFYLIWNPAFRFVGQKNMTGTAGQKRLPVDFLREYKIPLPPLPEQKRIAAILDKADAIRRKRQEAIKLADDFLRATFLDMFGDPVTNPKGWKDFLFDEIAEIQGGLQLTKNRESNPKDVPYLRVANVFRDRLDLTEIKTMRVTQSELNRTLLTKGDILIVEGHGNPQEIGRAAIWDGSIATCTHQNHLIRARVHRDKADPIFVSAFLNSYGGRQQLLGFGKTTSGLNTISTSNVKETKILLPPVIIQRKYHQLADQLTNTTQKIKFNQDVNDNLFNALTQRAFRGEL